MSPVAVRLFYVVLGLLIGVGYNGYRILTHSLSVVDVIILIGLAALTYIYVVALQTYYRRRGYVIRAAGD